MSEAVACRRHPGWMLDEYQDDPQSRVLAVRMVCIKCGTVKDEARSRRGRTARSYGTRAELKAARKYGGEKIGHIGGPVDIRGKDFDTQVRTKRRKAPAEWVKASHAMNGERTPRILLRFVQTGTPPDDWFVFRAQDFLDWFGRDE